MTSIKRLLERSGAALAVLALGVAIVVPSLSSGKVSAATITSRSLNMASNSIGTITSDANGTAAAAGSYYNGAQTKHTFTWTMATSAPTVKAIVVQYCTTPLLNTACAVPGTMDASTVNTGTITSTGGLASNSWTVDTSLNLTNTSTFDLFQTANCAGVANVGRTNCVALTQSGASASTGTPSVTLPIGSATNGWIKNPTSAMNFFVRIYTFNSATTLNSSTLIDSGTVAGETTTGIDITSAVQETLNFSVAAANTTQGANCATETGSGAVSLGQLTGTVPVLDPTRVDTAHSYWRLNTNAINGSTVQYSGDTLKTAGGSPYSIAAAGSSAVAITAGTEKFGMTVDTTDGANSMTNLASQAPYNTANYAYDTTSTTTPKTIASVAAGTPVTCDTGAMKYAATIGTTTKPGLYKTSISYFATPTY